MSNNSSPPRQLPRNELMIFNEIEEEMFSESLEINKLNSIENDSFEFDDSDDDPNYLPGKQDLDISDNETPIRKRKVPRKQKEAIKPNESDILTNNIIVSTTSIDENQGNQHALTTNNAIENNLKRKRLSNPGSWKKNISKIARQKGKSYLDQKGRLREAKHIQGKCKLSCIFSCGENISEQEQTELHSSFWELNDQQKLSFYNKNVKRKDVKKKSKETSRKIFSYRYFLPMDQKQIRVCQQFFLKTLNISKHRIYYFFRHLLNKDTLSPLLIKKGKYVKKETPTIIINQVKEHIESFPVSESHYCRSETKKKYLDSSLSIQKMYRMYLQWLTTSADTQNTRPATGNVYRRIFNTNYNYSFHIPKKDICDKCSLYNSNKKSPKKSKEYEVHRQNLEKCRFQRKQDRENDDPNVAIVCYDLQNVFNLPKSNISSFFYKRKFATYNLTGHCNRTQTTYCAIWSESHSGRSGNDIASALLKILESIGNDLPEVTEVTLWSDSCVPQNRNKITSLALMHFLKEHPTIQKISQKFSEPGHSCIQEIDAVHSAIEKHLRFQEIFSPVSLMRHLKSLKYPKVTLKILQMQPKDFLNFLKISECFEFQVIPFIKVKELIFTQRDYKSVGYKIDLTENPVFKLVLKSKNPRRKCYQEQLDELPNIPTANFKKILPLEKKRDIRSMMKYMPEIDQHYYEAVLK